MKLTNFNLFFRGYYFFKIRGVIILCTLIIATHAKAHSENFLVLTDVHLNQLSHHVMDFSPQKKMLSNDLDKTIFNHLIHHIKKAIKTGALKNPKFILYLGDIVSHTRSTQNIVLGSEAYFFKILSHEFPNTPILYTYGNIDSFTLDYGPFSSTFKNGDQKITPINIARLSAHWEGDFLSTGKKCNRLNDEYPCVLSQNIYDGYYSAYVSRKLRIISLNSVMLSKLSIIKNEKRINQQFQWLKNQLQEAQSQGESVILTMHIPPGKYIFNNEYFFDEKINSIFLEIIKNHQNSIVSILAAHTHFNEFKMLKDIHSQKNILPVHINGALSTAFGNGPSVNLFSYEKINHQWHLTDREVWLFHKNLQHDIRLKQIFSFKKTYCHAGELDLANCLNNLTLQQLEKSFFDTNYTFFKKVNCPENFIVDLASQ